MSTALGLTPDLLASLDPTDVPSFTLKLEVQLPRKKRMSKCLKVLSPLPNSMLKQCSYVINNTLCLLLREKFSHDGLSGTPGCEASWSWRRQGGFPRISKADHGRTGNCFFSVGTLGQKHARFLNMKSQLNFIIKGMWNADIQQLIFSSSCQVFLCKREIVSKDVLIAKKV